MTTAPGPDLTLIVPGLFGPAPPPGVDRRAARESLLEGLALGAVETLLSRARRVPVGHEFATPEDLCFGAFGYRRAAAADWPAAAVTRRGDLGDAAGGWYLRADPVHLKADMRDLVLFDGEFFELGLNEARELAGIVAGHFADHGWQIEVPHPLRWYLRLKQTPVIITTPLSAARLQPVNPHLPAGEDGASWRACMNEIQMLLHACPVNEARESRGEAAINSLWFWGGGALPDALPAGYSSVYADTALAAGLGALAGIPSRPLPAGGAPGILRASAGASVLAVMEAGYGPARGRDVDAWRRFMAGLEQNWFGPLKAALDTGELAALTVVSDCPVRFEVRPAHWWQRLRRPRSFADLAES